MTRNAMMLASIATLALGAPAAAQDSAEPPAATPVVETEAGKVQGLEQGGIDAFLGVRYAAPPLGELRFQPPEKPEAWDGVADATGYGAPCMQLYSASGPNESEMTRRIQAIFPTSTEAKMDNEDCLFLNVWTPAAGDGKKRPVMVWFHGGGYAYGSGNWPAYNGRNLAEKGDVVVVTVNHRLNAFGYLNLAEKFGEDFAASGNVGNLDLVRSLQWVRDNIAGFGGDPDNVTIMGESGGGSKVSHLMAMPAADGLFDKAVIQSGPGVFSGKPAEAADYAAKILEAAGVETLDDLRAIRSDEIVDAVRRATPADSAMGRGPQFGPTADGTIIPRDPFLPAAPEQSRDIPVLIGYNKDEMTLFVAAQPWFGRLTEGTLNAMTGAMGEQAVAAVAAYRKRYPDYSPTHLAAIAMGTRFVRGTYLLADQQAKTASAPVYVYRLTWETPIGGGMLRTPHTLDIPLMFDNAVESAALVGAGEDAQIMAEMMSDAWIAFAKTGTPSSELLPEWKAYTPKTRNVMELNVEPRLVDDPEKDIRELPSEL
ncbi:carboxylesterase/lipase family protein [Citromicrobium sp. WPS32]|uniref:carboxylesterase/lipase family protein n=1 Tax=Citromicrobium sp. WPS32 TaxID=1634517 RepID=UPI0006C92A27|nr:carboxylesterase/lipase family protein [Citromicrobium sp. WPS32]MAY78854.1 carboxylesterase/lipase family protein [Citromicrobium sp.]|tara:strand:+ start:15941 stop:17560 length:1620 start_codon:yes stop_codon:yes gene_type:complete